MEDNNNYELEEEIEEVESEDIDEEYEEDADTESEESEEMETTTSDTPLSRYVWSLLIPIVGLIVGANLLSSDDTNERTSGSISLVCAVIGTLLYYFLVYRKIVY